MLPDLNTVLIWIVKLLAITVLIFICKRFDEDLKESASYFRLGIWIGCLVVMIIVVSTVTPIVFHDNQEAASRTLNIFHSITKIALPVLGVLVFGRVAYKKYLSHKLPG